MLQEYSHTGPKQVTVVCPGFATDCLETLEEINMQNREMYLAHGGEAFDYVPCLNSSAAHVAVLTEVVLQHAQGWPELTETAPDEAQLAQGVIARSRWARRTKHGAVAVVPLGRFLEISIATTDVAASLAFYESLGFVQADVGEAWAYPYAVVTDGRVCLGLHQHEQPGGTTLTWVLPNLASELDRLEALGITLEHTRIDDTSLNSTGFVDPSGQAVTLLEARTFSPPALAESQPDALGYFEEFAIPTSDLRASAAFWEPLGFVAFEPVVEPFQKIVVDGARPEPRSV